MSDEKPTQQFEIQKVYLKDVSLETPNSPTIFTGQWQPETNVQIANASEQIAEHVYEVVLTLTVTTKLGEKIAYLTEVQQAGIFSIKGFNKEQMGAMLGAYCLNILFPFIRETIASLIQKGGFPPLLLNPVNFDALYLQRLQSARQAQGGEQSTGH